MTRPEHRDADLTPFTALSERLRRRLFVYVASTDEPVGRTQAAEALGITRSVAAFHMDKLVEVGLFAVEYRRPPGRRGPGAGRPAKLYRALVSELVFSVPERRYELAAAILSEAMAEAESGSVSVSDALRIAGAFVRAGHWCWLRGTGRSRIAEQPRAGRDRPDLVRLRALHLRESYRIGQLSLPRSGRDAARSHLRNEPPDVERPLKGSRRNGPRSTRVQPTLGRCCVTIRARALRAS